jgi:hypothetical protein
VIKDILKYTIVFMLIVSFNLSHAEIQDTIQSIKDRFSQWQPIIKKDLPHAKTLYHYAWGQNYEQDEWSYIDIKSDDKTLSEIIKYLKNDIGYFIYSEIHSFSGDWFITSEFYYDEKERLYSIFWRMNTFQADEPLTVEKRLYFDQKGNVIKNLVSKYKMNTQKKSEAGFYDRDVFYKFQLRDLEFFKYL